MRANTKKKHEMGKRFAIVIGRCIKHRTLLVLSLAAMVGAIAVPVAQAQRAGAVTTSCSCARSSVFSSTVTPAAPKVDCNDWLTSLSGERLDTSSLSLKPSL